MRKDKSYTLPKKKKLSIKYIKQNPKKLKCLCIWNLFLKHHYGTFHNKILQPLLTLLWLFSQVSFTPVKETKLSVQAYPGVIYYSMSDTECFILRRHTQGFHSLVSYRLKKLNKQTQKKTPENQTQPTKNQPNHKRKPTLERLSAASYIQIG